MRGTNFAGMSVEIVREEDFATCYSLNMNNLIWTEFFPKKMRPAARAEKYDEN